MNKHLKPFFDRPDWKLRLGLHEVPSFAPNEKYCDEWSTSGEYDNLDRLRLAMTRSRPLFDLEWREAEGQDGLKEEYNGQVLVIWRFGSQIRHVEYIDISDAIYNNWQGMLAGRFDRVPQYIAIGPAAALRITE